MDKNSNFRAPPKKQEFKPVVFCVVTELEVPHPPNPQFPKPKHSSTPINHNQQANINLQGKAYQRKSSP